jgi:hypothetical protein
LLDHYLDGTGEPVTLDPDTVMAFDNVRDALAVNRERFELITLEPYGSTGSPHERAIKRSLIELPDGETIKFETHWDNDIGSMGLEISALMDGINLENQMDPSEVESILSIGRANVDSFGTFTVSRTGDRLNVDGVVTHRLTDTYDFNPGNPLTVGPRSLAEHGVAREFKIFSEWQEQISGHIDRRPGQHRNGRDLEWSP